ncbi:anti-sigma regulatory factor [Heliobacterium chlorum]|uniref:Anti-sigma regulatory factor n=1 Tax=Heliobacterium chlorum TaxID=2698 RepID=A0ABR7T3F3_HELCL|nr:anti-sigma regulatory factor [Heliobacterium chlorum]MBC9785297.1 anti-sigma regulatory factor [Heliobacterium chlorum]
MPEIRVHGADDVGTARRQVLEYCRSLPFTMQELGQLAIIVTELATNLAKHASGGGVIRLETIGDRKGLILQSSDQGPGIPDVSLALLDGTPSTASLGGGLGAMRRLSDQFSIQSEPSGTVVTVKKWVEGIPTQRLTVGVYSRPHPEYGVSGEGFFVRQDAHRPTIALFDASGRGTTAYQNRLRMERTLWDLQGLSLLEIMGETHRQMMGAAERALFLAQVDYRQETLNYVGVGPIQAQLLTPDGHVPLKRTERWKGLDVLSLTLNQERWTAESILAVTTAGAVVDWEQVHYRSIQGGKPGQLCRQWVERWGRDDDEATILIARDER